MVAGLLGSLALRNPLKVDIIRDKRVLAREIEGKYIENVYKLNVMNTTEQAQRFTVSADGLADIRIDRGAQIEADPASTAASVLTIRIPVEVAEKVAAGSHTIFLTVKSDADASMSVREKAVFLVPR